MEQIHECKLIPTKEELSQLYDLQAQLKEYLGQTNKSSVIVQEALAKYATDQYFLLKFVRGRKLKLQKAFASVLRYTEVKHELYPEAFPNQIPDIVRYVIDKKILYILKRVDDQGRIILISSCENWDVSVVCVEDMLLAGRFMLDALMESTDLLTKGIVFVNNASGASMKQARQYTIPTIIKLVNIFWQAYPLSIKGTYYVNAPFFVKPIYILGKPFLPAKLKERILISSGVAELHERIPVSILPESLGGKLTEEEAISMSCFNMPDDPTDDVLR